MKLIRRSTFPKSIFATLSQSAQAASMRLGRLYFSKPLRCNGFGGVLPPLPFLIILHHVAEKGKKISHTKTKYHTRSHTICGGYSQPDSKGRCNKHLSHRRLRFVWPPSCVGIYAEWFASLTNLPAPSYTSCGHSAANTQMPQYGANHGIGYPVARSFAGWFLAGRTDWGYTWGRSAHLRSAPWLRPACPSYSLGRLSSW